MTPPLYAQHTGSANQPLTKRVMGHHPSSYLSYLLRLRYADNDRDPVWRISLESPDRLQQLTFRGLEELVNFLQSQMSQVERPSSKENGT